MKSWKSKPSLLKRVADRPGDFSVLYKELFDEKSSGLSTGYLVSSAERCASNNKLPHLYGVRSSEFFLDKLLRRDLDNVKSIAQ